MQDKNKIITLINKIWMDIYPSYVVDANTSVIIHSLRNTLSNLDKGDEYNLGYLHTLLQCIKYSISPKSSMHHKLPVYLKELDRMGKKTFTDWLKLCKNEI
jgi:hypothetical protein